MKRSILCSSILACGALLTLAGCIGEYERAEYNVVKVPGTEPKISTMHSGESGGAKMMAASPAGTVNKYCVINPNDEVAADSPTAEWKGQKVGFCCKGCLPDWDKKTEAEKDAALAAAIAKGKVGG